ncbi:hypothetical protein DFQ13_103492 [Actinokineospora spheciospongiae]|nr:hypothetical protein DFQ13_103492 [Actinokineospora spheciospongiae]
MVPDIGFCCGGDNLAGRRVPRGVVLTAVLCALVVAAALGGAALLRDRAAGHPAADTTSSPPVEPTPADAIGPDGCRPGEACQVLGRAAIGSTYLDLIGDPGGVSGRVRIGGPTTSQVIEVTVTESQVTLGPDSLVCRAAGISACLVRGGGERGVVGQVIVGRSGKWSPVNKAFFSAAGSLSLGDVNGDGTPEVLAVQCDRACPRVFVQVLTLAGDEQDCTRTYARPEQLPGYPAVEVTASALRACP